MIKIMKLKILVGVFILVAFSASAQDAFTRGMFSQGINDLGQIKLQAEQGDVTAQVKLADAYLAHFKSADALKWYEAAAKQNSVEGEYQLGNLLLFGRVGIPKEQQIQARPTEGLKWTYQAATSGHRGAWRNMARVLENGVGCSTNLVEAYAWLNLLADTGNIQERVEMNNLALKISAEQIVAAKNLTQQMKIGHWPPLSYQNNSKSDLGLKLDGLIPNGPEPLATINGKSVAEGETISIKIKNETLSVKCLKIKADSVTILVDGETEPRLLYMQ
jgi:TPR repeat protein